MQSSLRRAELNYFGITPPITRVSHPEYFYLLFVQNLLDAIQPVPILHDPWWVLLVDIYTRTPLCLRKRRSYVGVVVLVSESPCGDGRQTCQRLKKRAAKKSTATFNEQENDTQSWIVMIAAK